MNNDKDLYKYLEILDFVHFELVNFFKVQNALPQDMWDVMNTIREANEKFQDFIDLIEKHDGHLEYDAWAGNFNLTDDKWSTELCEDIYDFCWKWSIQI